MNTIPPTMNDPVAKLMLRISCENLANMDVLSKSDPIVVVWMAEGANWREVGRTEMIKDNLNPKFLKGISIDYRFEEIQKLRFGVYDIDREDASLEAQDFIGQTECRLSDIVTSSNSTLRAVLHSHQKGNQNRGFIVIMAEEQKELGLSLRMRWSASHLDGKNFFGLGKSDPFFVINRRQADRLIPVVKSEVIKETKDPQWIPFETTIQNLCNGELDKELLVEVFDWNRSGSHELIGTFTTTARALMEGKEKNYPVINTKKFASKKGYKDSGVVHILSSEVIRNPTFLEYLQGGCEINLVVAIDFTASNGKPQDPRSLHFNNPQTGNEYTQAIQAVGSILAGYDHDRMFPAYGFGANIPPNFQVSHCFPLNGNERNPEVYDVSGILNAYQATLNTVALYGPTNFAPIIRQVSELASQHSTQQDQRYFILLILTDGEITDMNNTIDAIIQAAKSLPLSIVIVGVGSSEFTNMNILDGDDHALKSVSGQVCSRDIVQFIPMRDFRNRPYDALAKATLEEIPSQLLSYMKLRSIKPNPPVVRPVRVYDDMNPNGLQQNLPPVSSGPPPASFVPPPTTYDLTGYNPPLDPNVYQQANKS